MSDKKTPIYKMLQSGRAGGICCLLLVFMLSACRVHRSSVVEEQERADVEQETSSSITTNHASVMADTMSVVAVRDTEYVSVVEDMVERIKEHIEEREDSTGKHTTTDRLIERTDRRDEKNGQSHVSATEERGSSGSDLSSVTTAREGTRTSHWQSDRHEESEAAVKETCFMSHLLWASIGFVLLFLFKPSVIRGIVLWIKENMNHGTEG